MPRKRLYHTREQQRLANNAKAKRWRDKNVEFVRTQREQKKRLEEQLRAQELRAKRQSARKLKDARASRSKKDMGEAKELEMDAQLIRPHLKEAERLYQDFRQKVPNKYDYVDRLYQKYTTPQPRSGQRHHSYLQDASKPLNKLIDTLGESSHAILNVAGPWDEWRKVEQMRADIRDLVQMIDDMWSFAVLDLETLQHAYETRELRYRQAAYVN
ncbi:hypothetical protein V5O48_008813 [Marasmius crinis-equi]|uniref:Uncharacterized protein n=1 Tax=Marasmius crinis-equi TaxID=585013 RepID=A0ABR3FCZ9_9AGAR